MSESNRTMKAMLDEVSGIVCGSRQDDYGLPERNHARTAEAFNWYLKHCPRATLDGHDICLLNVLQKISRDLNCRKRDNLTDICGFTVNAAACDAALAGMDGT